MARLTQEQQIDRDFAAYYVAKNCLPKHATLKQLRRLAELADRVQCWRLVGIDRADASKKK